MKYSIIFFILVFIHLQLSAQIPHGLVDARNNRMYCGSCSDLIAIKPSEVQYGISISRNGDVYFSMNNRDWFNKIFNNSASGIAVDVVSEDRYDCNSSNPPDGNLIRGTLLPPVYKSELAGQLKELQNDYIYVKIGKLPATLSKKKLEGNLLILNGNQICYYTNFLDIERSTWELLPMGLYTDSLVYQFTDTTGNKTNPFTYSKKVQVSVPFAKNRMDYSQNDIKPLYDSLHLKDFIIRKIDIRAYASVEGPEKINIDLMKGRADAMVKALRQYQPGLKRVKITTAENWIEFLKDIKNTEFAELSKLSKGEIKQKLLDYKDDTSMDSILSGHRKAIVTVYLERRTEASGISNDKLEQEFKNAIDQHSIEKARMLQREIVERIIDNSLPEYYLNQLEVPQEKLFTPLLNDRLVYNLFLQSIFEDEALEALMELKQLDSLNIRINYNICALRLILAQNEGKIEDSSTLIKDINRLSNLGIHNSLVKRMLINYHILKCEQYMRKYDYSAKDQSLAFIKINYRALVLNDEDIYSLAKYFSFYSRQEWAEEIVRTRIDKIDVSEDLVFYFVNLGFFHRERYADGNYQKAILNAINLNRNRFCNFFKPNHSGGAGMQLLESTELKRFYCESCSLKSQLLIGSISSQNPTIGISD